ncbi:ATP-dependent DNA helicase RecG [Halomonas campaniensis]|uniref:ATP-dependent DNA helicase RecG n=1 Tax=Halomonas campaniensis TaxID=213554 RepID=A0A7W5PAT8_9GAMM|nr:ATP-binding protein [Halomonas campaniensis]MBB3330261.1 ATP-dependent DNA helicase RecG [Halomonas campaniensis]
MNRQALNDLLALGEGFTTEFKKAGTSGLGREICAFANATGGVILIGVTDAGEVVGVADHNKLKSDVQATARSAEPPIAVEVESAGEVLCVTVPAQHSKPYSFGGKFYLREGASSQQMSRQEIREFFYREGLIHFDETPCERFSLEEDLTDEAWATFRRRARIPAEMPPLNALKNLHLLTEDGRMTHAGAWLLARDIQKFSISADVACALFMGTDKVHILDRRGFHGDVYSMIDEVMAWLLSKLNVAYIIRHVKREERPELPEEALREAVVNALVHRDYRSTANVHVYVFKDRVEVVSPGGLPAGMSEADLGIKSIPRNPLLFGMLHRMEAVEHIGSGIRRIRRLCSEYGVAEPEIEVSPHWFVLRFPRPVVAEEASQARPGPDATEVGDQAGTKSAPSRLQVGTKSALSRHQVAILVKCHEDQGITELMAVAGRSDRTKFRNQVLAPLLEEALLEMTIPDKPRSSKQRYRLTEHGRRYLEEHAPEPNDKDA